MIRRKSVVTFLRAPGAFPCQKGTVASTTPALVSEKETHQVTLQDFTVAANPHCFTHSSCVSPQTTLIIGVAVALIALNICIPAIWWELCVLTGVIQYTKRHVCTGITALLIRCVCVCVCVNYFTLSCMWDNLQQSWDGKKICRKKDCIVVVMLWGSNVIFLHLFLDSYY